MSAGAALTVTALSKAFGGVHAVADMSMSVPEGAITGLIGPNGAGKSTFFNLVSGVLPADAGRVTLFGEDITGLKPHRIVAKGMVRTFQLAREMARLTVLENMMLAASDQPGEGLAAPFFAPHRVRARERAVYDRAIEVLDIVALGHLRDEYAGNLSGGQKKLLELGRALMIDPRLVLLDEPGAGVNPTLMGLLCDMIRRLHEEFGKTVLIVEHDMDIIAKLCHRVVVMAEGRHLTEGTFAEVTNDARVIEAYLGGATA